MPLYGKPMLSMMLSTSPGGICVLIGHSRSENQRWRDGASPTSCARLYRALRRSTSAASWQPPSTSSEEAPRRAFPLDGLHARHDARRGPTSRPTQRRTGQGSTILDGSRKSIERGRPARVVPHGDQEKYRLTRPIFTRGKGASQIPCAKYTRKVWASKSFRAAKLRNSSVTSSLKLLPCLPCPPSGRLTCSMPNSPKLSASNSG